MKTCIHLFVLACVFGGGSAVATGQACDPIGSTPLPCRQIQVATIPSSALGSTIFVQQADDFFPENCQDNSYTWNVLVCVNAPNATSPIALELVMPHGLTAIRRLEIRGTMPQAPLRLTIRGVNGLLGPPAHDYLNAVVQEMVINPTAQVHVELTAYLSDVGRIECHAIRELIFLDDTRANAGPRCGPELAKVIGLLRNPPGQSSRILVRNNPNLAPPPLAITGIVSAEVRSARADLTQCVDFHTSVIVENGPVLLWNFPANWNLNSPEFKATNTTNGNFTRVLAGQIGPTASGGRVQMQAKNIDTLLTLAGGVYADIFAQTIDSMSGAGINAVQGLSGSITAQTVAAGSQIRFANPGALNGVALGSLIRLNSLPAGAVIDLPANGLQGPIILNASDATPASAGWLGDVRVGGQVIAHSGAQYTPDVSTSTHGGGSVGLTRFARHNADCSPQSGGLRTLAAFFSGTNPVIVEYYGPVRDLDADTTRPPVRIQ